MYFFAFRPQKTRTATARFLPKATAKLQPFSELAKFFQRKMRKKFNKNFFDG